MKKQRTLQLKKQAEEEQPKEIRVVDLDDSAVENAASDSEESNLQSESNILDKEESKEVGVNGFHSNRGSDAMQRSMTKNSSGSKAPLRTSEVRLEDAGDTPYASMNNSIEDDSKEQNDEEEKKKLEDDSKVKDEEEEGGEADGSRYHNRESLYSRRGPDTEEEKARKRLNRIVPNKDFRELAKTNETVRRASISQPHSEAGRSSHVLGDDESKKSEVQDNREFEKEKLKEQKKMQRLREHRRNIKRKMKPIEIRALEFDWLFNEREGARFLNKVANSDSIDLYSLEIIRNIIDFFWGYFKPKIFVYNFIPFILSFILTIVFVTYTHDERVQEGEKWGKFYTANFVVMAALAFICLYQIFLELLQLKNKGFKYFKSGWNLITLLSIGLIGWSIAFDYLEWNEEKYFIPTASCAVLIMYLRLFYFGRIFKATATIVRMIIEVTQDIKPFMVITFIMVLGFTNAFYILALNKPDPDAGEEDEGRFTDDHFLKAVTYTWQQSLGEFDTESYEELNREALAYVLWFGNTFMVMVLFLNLLIAVLSDSFDKIQETLKNNLYKEFARMMVDNEMFLNRKSTFKGVKYLILVEKKDQKFRPQEWQGKLDYVKRQMEKKGEEQIEMMNFIEKRMEHHHDTVMDNRLLTLDGQSTKLLNYLGEKVDRLEYNMALYEEAFDDIMKM